MVGGIVTKIELIIIGIISGIIVVGLVAIIVNIYKHRRNPHRILGGHPASFLSKFISILKKKETPEQKENREFRDKIESDNGWDDTTPPK